MQTALPCRSYRKAVGLHAGSNCLMRKLRQYSCDTATSSPDS
jgi:hypothetical protein